MKASAALPKSAGRQGEINAESLPAETERGNAVARHQLQQDVEDHGCMWILRCPSMWERGRPVSGNRTDLPLDLRFQLPAQGLQEKVAHAGHDRIIGEIPRPVRDGRETVVGRRRLPLDEGEVEPHLEPGVVARQGNGFGESRAIYHEGGAGQDPFPPGSDDRPVGAVRETEIVGIDDQFFHNDNLPLRHRETEQKQWDANLKTNQSYHQADAAGTDNKHFDALFASKNEELDITGFLSSFLIQRNRLNLPS